MGKRALSSSNDFSLMWRRKVLKYDENDAGSTEEEEEDSQQHYCDENGCWLNTYWDKDDGQWWVQWSGDCGTSRRMATG